MITNDRQYRIVKSQMENFQKAVETMAFETEDTKDVHPIILQAEKDGLIYEIQKLQADLKEYEDLKEGRVIVTAVKDLKELPIILIKARIANGLTQAELAAKLGMKEQQIQKYEAENYESVSLRTLLRIATELRISIDGDIQFKEVRSTDLLDVSNFPIKQMYKRRWFPEFSGSLNDAVRNSSTLIANLFQNAGIENMQTALNRRSIRTSAVVNRDALNVWYARVIIKAREQELEHYFDKNGVDTQWFNHLASYTNHDDGPEQAVKFLKNSGIRVIFEAQLEGTYLDGAALLIDKVFPAIAMTLRYDRLDNFWFVLFHELAHIILHLGVEFDSIFDDLDTREEGIEKEADNFALNIAIPDSVWKKSLVRFSPSDKTIINQALSLKVHPAIIAGRVRWESQDFYKYNNLVGQGEVRKKFIEELN
jgi:HTH-type transcriptional regulator / antitoxin HigA